MKTIRLKGASMEILQGALAGGLVLLVVDGLWLGLIAREWIGRQVGHLMREPILWQPAVAFYLLYAVGIGFFAVEPAMTAGGDWVMALWRGAFLGLVAYGTYDLTNWSTLKGWPRGFAIVDLIWGPAVTAVSAAGGVVILNLF
jgi:uncharacterized membrane protein